MTASKKRRAFCPIFEGTLWPAATLPTHNSDKRDGSFCPNFFLETKKWRCGVNVKKAGSRSSRASFDVVWQLNAVVVLLAVVLLHHLDQVDNLVAVANLVVIPRNHLHELVGQVYTSVGIED